MDFRPLSDEDQQKAKKLAMASLKPASSSPSTPSKKRPKKQKRHKVERSIPEIDMLPFVRRATTQEILGLVPGLTEEDLKPLPIECECGSVPIGAPCSTCGEEPELDAYPPWPTLVAINEVLAPGRPRPKSVDYSMTQEKRARVLARRHAQGFGLWNDEDLVYIDHASEIGEAMERMIFTLSGWKARGRPDEVEHEPLKNGHELPGAPRLRGAA